MSNTPGSDPKSDADIISAEQASAADPGNFNLAIQLSHLLLTAGYIGRAVQEADRAAAAAPDDFRVVRFLSGVQAVAGLNEAAIASGTHAVELAPTNAEARMHLAGLLISQQRPRAALPHLLALAGGAGATGWAWRMLSFAMVELGQPDRAIEAIDQAILLSPNETEYRIHRASVLIERHKLDAALQELDVALEQAPEDGRIWRLRSGLFDQLGQAGQALADAERAAALNPEDGEWRAHVRHMQINMGLLVDAGNAPDPAALEVLAASWMQAHSRSPPRVAAVSGLCPSMCAKVVAG
jgi:tetratricopeptide (TPR) repeat protein